MNNSQYTTVNYYFFYNYFSYLKILITVILCQGDHMIQISIQKLLLIGHFFPILQLNLIKFKAIL